MRSFKAAATRELRVRGLWDARPFWQSNFCDRIIRDETELERIREYISHNPIAWQFDSENPDRMPNEDYAQLWAWLENSAAMP